MSKFERRLKDFASRVSSWWSSSAKSARERGTDSGASLRREASARAQQAAGRVKDFRESERGQQAATKLSDLRSSETAKKAETALSDLRQREPVKKAEESARKVLNDLFSGNGSGSGGSTADH